MAGPALPDHHQVLWDAIQQQQARWIEDSDDRKWDLSLAPATVARWWDAARLISVAPPVPRMPAPLPGRVSDIQEARSGGRRALAVV